MCGQKEQQAYTYIATEHNLCIYRAKSVLRAVQSSCKTSTARSGSCELYQDEGHLSNELQEVQGVVGSTFCVNRYKFTEGIQGILV